MKSRLFDKVKLSALVLLAVAGCARAPSGAVTGRRIIVTLTFDDSVKGLFQYFFLIRNANDPSGVNGPVPVIAPPYLNGFATGINSASAAFTDFVEYSTAQRAQPLSGYALYHVPLGINGNPNNNIFQFRGEPDVAHPPNGGKTISFELRMASIQPSPGEADPNNGQSPQFLQINVVATTTTPIDPQTVDPTKFLDAFGDQSAGVFTAFATIDLRTANTYISNNIPGDPRYEPSNDTWPHLSDPAIELVQWTVQVIPQ